MSEENGCGRCEKGSERREIENDEISLDGRNVAVACMFDIMLWIGFIWLFT